MAPWEIAILCVGIFAVLMIVVSSIIMVRLLIKNQHKEQSEQKRLFSIWKINGMTAPIFLGVLLIIACIVLAIVFDFAL